MKSSLYAGLDGAVRALALDGDDHPDEVGERAVAQVTPRRARLQVQVHICDQKVILDGM